MADIEKDSILEFVNDVLNEKFQDGDIDSEIKTVLTKLSNKDLLVASVTPTINANDLSLAYPAGFRAMVSFTLTDQSGVSYDPLIKISHDDYRSFKSNDSGTGRPERYSDFNNTFFLWRPSNAEYDVLMEYYKNHPLDPDNIEFGEMFEEAINAGVTYYKARNKNKQSYGFWKGEWLEAVKEIVQSFPRNPRIVP